VEWAASRAWLKVRSGLNGETLVSMTPLTPGYHNGYIAVIPITRLTAPLEKPIDVNIWVSSDNMQVNYLNAGAFPDERKIFTESAQIHPIGVTDVVLNKSSASQDCINEEHFGENPVSFRLLMKRFVSVGLQTITTSTGTFHIISYQQNNIPKMKAAYSTAPSSQPVLNLIDYLRYAFLGIRGGIRYRWRFLQPLNSDIYKFALVSNMLPEVDAANAVNDVNAVGSSIPAQLRGSVAYNFNNNAGIEYEVPFYTNNLFVFSFSYTLDGGQNTTDDDMETSWIRRHELAFWYNTASARIDQDYEVATGEDFNFLRFGGAPYYSHL